MAVWQRSFLDSALLVGIIRTSCRRFLFYARAARFPLLCIGDVKVQVGHIDGYRSCAAEPQCLESSIIRKE